MSCIDHHPVRRISNLRAEFLPGNAFCWLICLQSERFLPEQKSEPDKNSTECQNHNIPEYADYIFSLFSPV